MNNKNEFKILLNAINILILFMFIKLTISINKPINNKILLNVEK
jgi:hypothetical protein